MEEIGKLVEEVLKQEGMGEVNSLVAIKREWPNIAAGGRTGAVIPYKLEGGRLYLGVESHPWAQEIHFERDRIIKEIESHLGIRIKDLVIRKVNL